MHNVENASWQPKSLMHAKPAPQYPSAPQQLFSKNPAQVMPISAPHCPLVESLGVAAALTEEVVFDVEESLVEVESVEVDKLLLVVVAIVAVGGLLLVLVDVMSVEEIDEGVLVTEELDRLEELVEGDVVDELLEGKPVVLEATDVVVMLVVDVLVVDGVLGTRILDAEEADDDVLDDC